MTGHDVDEKTVEADRDTDFGMALIAPRRHDARPARLFVAGDIAATVNNIASEAALFRLGIVCELI